MSSKKIELFHHTNGLQLAILIPLALTEPSCLSTITGALCWLASSPAAHQEKHKSYIYIYHKQLAYFFQEFIGFFQEFWFLSRIFY